MPDVNLAVEWKPGDLVQLKSGGPWMVVESINGNLVWCAWFWEQNFHKAGFNMAALVAAGT